MSTARWSAAQAFTPTNFWRLPPFIANLKCGAVVQERFREDIMKSRCAIVALASFGLSLIAFAAQAAEIKLLEGNALKPVLDELGPQFEKSTGNTITATLGTSAQLKSRIESGEAFDAVLLTKAALDDLVKQGKVADTPRAGIAHVGIGVAVKKGAPKPDLSTVEAFKQAMLNAKSVGYVDQTPTGATLKTLFAKLGIADQMAPKLKPSNKQAADAIADGDVEIGMTQISEILSYPSVELAGPLPPDIQTYTVFAGGVSAAAKNADGAAALIKFLTTPAAVSVIKSKGMDPG
jgi:molybdate transport system substrate-binding protein